MTSQMRVGVVGCGAFCRGTHIPNIARNPAMKLTAFCDLNRATLTDLENLYHPGYVTDDIERLLSDPQIDMVVCGTKPDARLPIMRLAARYRKPLFVEKPLCYREEDIPEMVSLIRESGIPFMVGFNRPYSPMMQSLRPLFRRHCKGNVIIIYRIIGESALWPQSHWKAIMEQKESTLVHEGTHIFDLLNWLTGNAPLRVYTAGAGHVDNLVTLTYPDNTVAVVASGDNGTAGHPKERIEIFSNGGVLTGDEFVELNVVGFDEPPHKQTFDFSQEGRPCSGGVAEVAKRYAAWRASVTAAERAYGYYYDRMPRVNKGHYEELEYFRSCVAEGRMPETDVRRGAMANLIAWRALDSWCSGKPVDLNFHALES